MKEERVFKSGDVIVTLNCPIKNNRTIYNPYIIEDQLRWGQVKGSSNTPHEWPLNKIKIIKSIEQVVNNYEIF